MIDWKNHIIEISKWNEMVQLMASLQRHSHEFLKRFNLSETQRFKNKTHKRTKRASEQCYAHIRVNEQPIINRWLLSSSMCWAANKPACQYVKRSENTEIIYYAQHMCCTVLYMCVLFKRMWSILKFSFPFCLIQRVNNNQICQYASGALFASWIASVEQKQTTCELKMKRNEKKKKTKYVDTRTYIDVCQKASSLYWQNTEQKAVAFKFRKLKIIVVWNHSLVLIRSVVWNRRCHCRQIRVPFT